MAFDGFKYDRTFIADADLSAKQFHLVAMATTINQVSAIAAITTQPIGVLQNKPSGEGKVAIVRVLGETKIEAGATLTYGELIGTTTAGKADDITHGSETTVFKVGVVSDKGGASGEIVTAIIDCIAPYVAYPVT